LWTTFETADIYRFLTGEEDTVPEFQYNWTTVPKLQPLDPANTPIAPANPAPPAPPPAPVLPPVSPTSTDSSRSPTTSSPHSLPTPSTSGTRPKTNTASTSSKLATRPFRSFHLRYHSTTSSSEGSQPEATLQGRLQGPQYWRFAIRTSRIPETLFQSRRLGKKIRGQGQKNVFSLNCSHQSHETLCHLLRPHQNDHGMSFSGIGTRDHQRNHTNNLPTWLKPHTMFQHPFRTPVRLQNSSRNSTPQHGHEHQTSGLCTRIYTRNS